MDSHLKLYVLGALTEEKNDQDKSRIFTGEPPYDGFYTETLGLDIDPDDIEDELPEAKAYFESYEFAPGQLEQIRYLGIEPENSVYEMLINPFTDDFPKIKSLEGIPLLVNLETILLNEVEPGCSLAPLAMLPNLKEISGLSVRISDYSPLLDIAGLKSVYVTGTVSRKDFAANLEVLEKLREKGVDIKGNLLVQ